MPPPRLQPRGEPSDRRLKILLAAEKLFATTGFHGVSIRDIAGEAGVPLALVGYHFGSKQDLYRAIFESWRPMLETRRQQLAEAMAATPVSTRLERVLDAFMAPVLAMHQHPEGRYYAQMAARDLAAPAPEAEEIHREYFDPFATAFIDALCALHPAATRGQVAWCYQFMLGALLHHMTDQRVERLSSGENRAADPAARHHLRAFVIAGFKAVLGSGRA